MKLVEIKCSRCGAVLKVSNDSNDVHCDHCKANYKLDDEVKHVKYDEMEKAGYDYEKGRIRAQQEHAQEKEQERLAATRSIKSKNTAMILCALSFVGLGGIHDFYLGRIGSGVIKFLTMNWFFIGAIIDLISLSSGRYTDGSGKTLI